MGSKGVELQRNLNVEQDNENHVSRIHVQSNTKGVQHNDEVEEIKKQTEKNLKKSR